MDNKPEDGNSENAAANLGRNEPCPCGSGKKYKRCHGVNAAPKMSIPSVGTGMSGMSGAMAGAGSAGGMPGGLPFDVNSLDPQWMMQFSQALQRLPAGQMQKLQAIMQKAMAGKDVTREAADFEKHLPPQFQSLLKSFKMPEGAAGAPGMPDLSQMGNLPGGFPGFPAGMENPLAGMSPEEIQKQMSAFMESSEAIEAESAPVMPVMDEDEAKKIVAAALAEGKISQEQAASLLGTDATSPDGKATSAAASGSDESGSKFSKLWKSVKGK